jgi:hypothetical protein
MCNSQPYQTKSLTNRFTSTFVIVFIASAYAPYKFANVGAVQIPPAVHFSAPVSPFGTGSVTGRAPLAPGQKIPEIAKRESLHTYRHWVTLDIRCQMTRC